jgi:hypothetical protein
MYTYIYIHTYIYTYIYIHIYILRISQIHAGREKKQRIFRHVSWVMSRRHLFAELWDVEGGDNLGMDPLLQLWYLVTSQKSFDC